MVNDFTGQRVVNLIAQLDEALDEATRAGIMEACGRKCARAGAVEAARQANGDVGTLVATLRGWIGDDNIAIDGDTVSVRYPKCFCEMAHGIEGLSPTYCLCSAGWLSEMFETASGHPVGVLIHETVIRGGTACRFTVKL